MNYVSTGNEYNSTNEADIRANYKNASVPTQTEAIDLKGPEAYIGTTKKTSSEIEYTLQQIIDMSRAQTAQERASAGEGTFIGRRFDD